MKFLYFLGHAQCNLSKKNYRLLIARILYTVVHLYSCNDTDANICKLELYKK